MILNENALGGHIFHIYEDPEMSFYGIKDILVKAAGGELKGTEKIDGINAMLTYSPKEKVGKLFRNKNGGMTKDQVIQKYSDPKKQIVGKVFAAALDAFEKFCSTLDIYSLTEIFGNGDKLYNCEIVDSNLPNVIHYDGNRIVFHLTGHKMIREGQMIPSEFTNELQYLGKTFTQYSNENYKFDINKEIELKELSNKEILKQTIDKLNEEMQRSQVKDSDTIKTYLISRKNQGFANKDSQLQTLRQIITPYAQSLLQGMASQYIENEDQELDRLNKLGSEQKISTSTEGFVFYYNKKLYKFTGTFSEMNKMVNDQRKLNENVTSESYMFFPGSFKPPHKGHMALVSKYAPKVNNFVIVVSQKVRDNGDTVVDSSLSREVWDKYLEKAGLLDKVKFVVSDVSPVMKTFDYINNEVPQGSKVYLLKSSKDKNDNRFKLKPKRNDITIKELEVKPIGNLSSTDFRRAIDEQDLLEMEKFLPDFIKHKDLFSEFIIEKAKNPEEIPISLNETLDDLDEFILSEIIRKTGNKYCLYSKKSNRNLGCYPSKKGAKKREQQVNYFKSIKEDGVANSMGAGGIQGFVGNAFSDEDE